MKATVFSIQQQAEVASLLPYENQLEWICFVAPPTGGAPALLVSITVIKSVSSS